MTVMMSETSFTHGRSSVMPLNGAPTTGAEALTAAGLDWTVARVPMSDLLGDVKNADRHSVTVRSTDGAIVGVNGGRHSLIQNEVLAEFGDTVQQFRPDARYIAGGASATGELVFLQMELDEPIRFGGDDDLGRRQLLFATDHNGRYPLFGAAVSFRLGCMNQWSGMMKDQQRIFSVRHTITADQRIKLAHHAVVEAVRQFDEMDRLINQLLDTPVRLSEVEEAIVGKRPDDATGRAQTEWTKRSEALWAEYSADWNTHLAGTALGVVMAAQGVDEHAGRCKHGQREQQRLNRMVTSNYPMMHRALAAV